VSRVLVAEDEERISSFVEKGLRAAGYGCAVVSSGADALDHALSGQFDLVLLDIGLPGMDGIEVLRRIREADEQIPVILLTARNSVADTVAGLDTGANDYIPKPFKFDELLARIRTRLRDSPQQSTPKLVHGELSLDLRTRRALLSGRYIDLSAREFALAEEFLRHSDQVLSREQLLSRVWGLDFDPGSNVVDVYVRYLRAKFGADMIVTVRGMGYRLK
jgi:DNA-binding response OmpR family regulator